MVKRTSLLAICISHVALGVKAVLKRFQRVQLNSFSLGYIFRDSVILEAKPRWHPCKKGPKSLFSHMKNTQEVGKGIFTVLFLFPYIQLQGRIQKFQKEGAQSPTLPPPRMKTSLYRTCNIKVTLAFQKHFENTRKTGEARPPPPLS